MSRIGKTPVPVPEKVKVSLNGRVIAVEGPKGKLDWELPGRTSGEVLENQVIIKRDGDDKDAKAQHGLARALVNNMAVSYTHLTLPTKA